MVGPELHARLVGTSGMAAALTVPWVLEWIRPRSVVDLGCNVGVWLRAFMDLGVEDVLGFDQPTIERSKLKIPNDRFVGTDLGQPLHLDRTFDLSMCLEVAEHVPLAASDQLVRQLVELAPVVLFAAAVPGQGGDGHVNEQWGSWWAERFARHGLERFDVLRHRLWDEPEVQWWYSQNIAVYAPPDHPAAERLRVEAQPLPIDVVHPRLFDEATHRPPTLPTLLRGLPTALGASAQHHLVERRRARRRSSP